MKRDVHIYLEDILDSIHKIEEYIHDMTFISFEDNYHTQDAVMRRLEIIGEATSKLPHEYIESNPQVEWRKMKGLRNIIIHDYGSVDIKQIWAIITTDLPHTKIQIEHILKG